MGGIGSGNRVHSIRDLKIRRIDRAWKNIDLILEGRENELKPFQQKASLDIALRIMPNKIEGDNLVKEIIIVHTTNKENLTGNICREIPIPIS